MPLDPTNDAVFKMLMTRTPVLLHDMLQGVLARPLGEVVVLNPFVPGQRPADRTIVFDIHAAIENDSRVDLEMQRLVSPDLGSRMVYYTSRNYADQLDRGDEYHLLKPTTGIIWMVQPLFPELERLHSRFELLDSDTHTRWGDQLSLHLLQLAHRPPRSSGLPPVRGYTARVERWARFLYAEDDDERRDLAIEDPIMTLANQKLERLSLDPDASRLAREREEHHMFHRMALAMSRAEGKAEGQAQGEADGKVIGRVEGGAALLLKLIGLRFGPPSPSIRTRVLAATASQLDVWADRVLTAHSMDDVLGP